MKAGGSPPAVPGAGPRGNGGAGPGPAHTKGAPRTPPPAAAAPASPRRWAPGPRGGSPRGLAPSPIPAPPLPGYKKPLPPRRAARCLTHPRPGLSALLPPPAARPRSARAALPPALPPRRRRPPASPSRTERQTRRPNRRRAHWRAPRAAPIGRARTGGPLAPIRRGAGRAGGRGLAPHVRGGQGGEGELFVLALPPPGGRGAGPRGAGGARGLAARGGAAPRFESVRKWER